MREPSNLKRGKAFHRRVQQNWRKTNRDGRVSIEHTINLNNQQTKVNRIRRGRLDLFIDEMDQLVSIVEIKSTNWDKIKPANIKSLLGSHSRQVWKYIIEYTDGKKLDVCPGLIYPSSPRTRGLREKIEQDLNERGIQVVWFADP